MALDCYVGATSIVDAPEVANATRQVSVASQRPVTSEVLAPAFDGSVNLPAIAEGDTSSYSFATDFANGPTSFTDIGWPAGFSMNSAGLLLWDGTQTAGTTTGRQVTAINAQGSDTTGAFDLTVSAAGSSLSAPGVSGAIQDDGVITIDWDGVNSFGTGGAPNIAMWTRFEADTVGQPIGLNTPEIGSFFGVTGVSTILSTPARSKGRCARQVATNQDWSIAKVQFPDSQKVFTSVSVRHSVESQIWQPGSAKLFWYMDTDSGFDSGDGKWDLVMPTRQSGSAWSLGGNSVQHVNQSSRNVNPSGSADEWVYWENWINYDGSDANITRTSSACHGASVTYGSVTNTNTNSDFWDGNGQQINQVNVYGNPGFNRAPGPGTWDFLIDDYYVAYGDACTARVLIGNASTLSACTRVAICPISARSSSSITATINQSDFASLSGAYLFVMDENDTVVPYSGSEGRLIS